MGSHFICPSPIRMEASHAAPTEQVEARQVEEPMSWVTRAKESFDVECAGTENALETPWVFWFDKKLAHNVTNPQEYVENLQKHGEVHSVEQFWSVYSNLLRPSDLPKDCNYHFMRYRGMPMWECYPEGGCWLIKTKKMHNLNRMWELLLLASVGETFGDPDMVGVGVSTRPRGNVLSVWVKDNSNETKISIGEKLNQILNLQDGATIEYKPHHSSMKDRSTFRNARAYKLVATGEGAEEGEAAAAPAIPPAELPPPVVEES